MPFTPFHMGAALIFKPAAGNRFSLLTFGIAQIAMDIEPGVGMLFDRSVLHGPSHTLLGALAIAALTAWIAPWLCRPILRRYNVEVVHYGLPWMREPETVTRAAAVSGAYFGTLSHIALDSLMHHDIHPLAPFTNANPLLGLVPHDGVYLLCAVSAVLGSALLLWNKWRRPTL